MLYELLGMSQRASGVCDFVHAGRAMAKKVVFFSIVNSNEDVDSIDKQTCT